MSGTMTAGIWALYGAGALLTGYFLAKRGVFKNDWLVILFALFWPASLIVGVILCLLAIVLIWISIPHYEREDVSREE